MSVKARMANNSENWARIERTKSKLGKSPQDEEQRKKLTARQATLAAENKKLRGSDVVQSVRQMSQPVVNGLILPKKAPRLGDAARRAENTKHAAARARTVISRMTESKKAGDKGDMVKNSEDWARLENARRSLPENSPLKNSIPRFQDDLHARNVTLAEKKNVHYDEPSGEWRKANGGRAYAAKGTPEMPLAEGKEYTALDRLGRAGKSIGKNLVGMLPALVETSQQIADNVEVDSKKAGLVAMKSEAESLRAWLTTVSFETAGETPEYKQRSARYQELLKQIEDIDTDAAVDENKFGQRIMKDAARDAAKATEGMTGAGKFLADTGISITNSAVTLPTAAISPAVPLALMGTQAAAKKTVELNQRGIAPNEALLRGIAAGGIEAATEKIPVDTLLDVVKSGGRGALKNILKQAGIEATEEGISYAANYLADVAANDPEAAFSLQEFGASVAGGALSGGTMAGIGTGINYAANRTNGNTAPMEMVTEQTNTPQVAAQANPMAQMPQQAMQQQAQQAQQAVQQQVQQQAMQQPVAQQQVAQQAIPQQQPITRPEVRTMNQTPDYDITGYTLSDAAVNLGNALAESGDPVGALRELKSVYQPTYDRAIQNASEYVASYKPQGTVVVGADEYGRGGYRASQNEPWYSDFYKKNGKAPTKADIPAIAKQLVAADKDGSQFGLQAKSMQMLEAIDELESRVFNRDGFTGFTENAQGDVQAVYDMDAGMAGKVPADATTGAAPAGFDPYSRMANEYGTIEPGENPARTIDVPQSTDGTDRVRRFTRTMMEAEATPESMIADFEHLVEAGQASYKPRKNKTDLDSAVKYIEQNGFERSLAAWDDKMQSGGKVDADDLIRAQIMYAAAAKEGDTQTAMRLAGQMAAEYTKAGQAAQSARILKNATPDGRLYYIKRSVDNLQDNLTREREGKAPQIQIDDTLAQGVLEAKSEAELTDAADALMKDVARQIPGTWADKINAWRYLSMLGNPRTHIRNLVGNFVFSLPVSAKNKIGAVLETAFIRDGERTKSVLPADKITQDFAKADAAEMMDVLKGGGKYNPADIIREHQDPFSPKWLLGRALNKASKANSNALDAEDGIFLGKHYRNALSGYMKANGLDPAQMTNELGQATLALEKARTYAINEAQKATFRDASAVADALARLEKTNAGTKILMGGLVPFKKTPINIVKRGVEYSPIGLIDGLKQAGVDLRRGTKTPTEAIDRIASGLTGTGLMMLGAFLAEQGILSGASAEERKEQYLNDAEGMQSYALNLGGYTYTVDWSAPASLPLFMGVEMHNAIRDGFDGLPALVDAMQNITEPIFNLTMMDGVQGAIKAAAYGGDNAITAAAGNMVSDYMGQFVPTASGQIARTIDGTRRTPYKGNEITGFPSVDVWLQRQQAKIPGASKSLAPYMDVFGRTSDVKPIAMRAFENMLSPGYIAKKKPDGATEGLRALHDATGDSTALPNKPDRSFKVDGEDVKLDQEQYVQFVQTRSQTIQGGLSDLFDSAAYSSMKDADRLSAVRKLYDYATADAKTGVSKYEMDSTQKRAKDSGVSPGTFYAYKQQLDSLRDGKDPDAMWKTAESIMSDQGMEDADKDKLMESLIIDSISETAATKYATEYRGIMAPETYIRLRNEYSKVKKAHEEQENAPGKSQAAWIEYLDKTGLSPDVRKKVEDDIKFWSMIPAKPDSTSFDMLSRYGGKKEQENAARVESSGLTLDQYKSAKEYKSGLTGDGQKDRVLEWMRGQGWTSAQVNAAGAAMGYKMTTTKSTTTKSTKSTKSTAAKSSTPRLGRPAAPRKPKLP